MHTAAGWTTLRSFGAGHLAPVLSDTLPSGYSTNFGIFSASDLGLAQDAVFDGVRIQACCGLDSHFDILAVAVDVAVPVIAVVPEPGTYALLLSGLFVFGRVARRRRVGAIETQPDSAGSRG